MWQWQYLRAQEIARERIAEANDWRRARNAGRARSAGQAQQDAQPRRNAVARGLRRALSIAE
jgi:hypothetical protein